MPMMDMSAALCNPFTLDAFGVIRRTEDIGSNGRGSITTSSPATVYGVVSPEQVKDIHRRDDGTLPSGVIGIVTRFPLANEAQGRQADIVTWRGNQWLVMEIQDYSNFGQGFVRAVCHLLDTVLIPPTMGPSGYGAEPYGDSPLGE